jgi:hypothetical protein
MVTATPAHYDIFTRHQPTHSSDTQGDHFGDELILPKPTNTTRCEFRNINGISIGKQGLQFRDVFEQERDISADILISNILQSPVCIIRLHNRHSGCTIVEFWEAVILIIHLLFDSGELSRWR